MNPANLLSDNDYQIVKKASTSNENMWLKIKWDWGCARDGRVEDPELISSHGHSKITAYRATVYEDNLSASTKDFPKVKLLWRNLSEMTGAGADAEPQCSGMHPPSW